MAVYNQDIKNVYENQRKRTEGIARAGIMKQETTNQLMHQWLSILQRNYNNKHIDLKTLERNKL